MSLKTEWLDVIEKLAELGSISAAAKELGYTQQALSYTLGLCEQYFKCSLFERQSRSMVITHEGQRVLSLIRNYLKQIEQLQQSMKEFQEHGLPRKWRIARSNSFTSSNQLGLCLSQITQKFPDYSLSLEWIIQHQLETVMLQENFPLAFSFYPAKSAVLSSYPIFESRYVWVVRSDRARQASLPVIEFKYHYLNRAKTIFHEGSDYLYLSELLPQDGASNIVSGNMLEILQLLKAGCGKACVPLVDVAEELESGQLTLLETTSEKVTGFLLVAKALLPKEFTHWLHARFSDLIL